jgi:hypothetical protein
MSPLNEDPWFPSLTPTDPLNENPWTFPTKLESTIHYPPTAAEKEKNSILRLPTKE